jgi:hypothetical protein
VDVIELRKVCDVAADALCAREVDRRAGALTLTSGEFHDGRVWHALAAYRVAWEAFHEVEDDGRSLADVLCVYLANLRHSSLF